MLNPITYTEKDVGDFLRYQLTTYPFAKRGLHDQMRRLLNLEETRATPLHAERLDALLGRAGTGSAVRKDDPSPKPSLATDLFGSGVATARSRRR